MASYISIFGFVNIGLEGKICGQNCTKYFSRKANFNICVHVLFIYYSFSLSILIDINMNDQPKHQRRFGYVIYVVRYQQEGKKGGI
jgi:hypothetical protein